MEKEDAIAIIGIACRFPGADDIDEFWEVLKNGEDHVHIIPKERWDTEAINIPDLNDDWKPSARKSGLIKDSDKWDNKFFGISDSEAGWMDPQQCLALEVTYTALEDGGFTKEKLKGTNTGVYIGVMNRDLSFGLNDASPEFNNFVATGIATSVIANRISYHFDIRGPSMTVDTACSSALVSIHLGSQAIKSGVMNRDLSFGLNDASPEFNNFVATGIATSVIANRISYHFDIRGPSMTVDTACSSALVSIHLGSQAIKSGDCNMAICGGVNSLLTPINYIVLNKARMISTTGKSHTFSADADGYVRGEGCGMVILKSLKKAMEDGDKIWGIVMSGCNQDGKASTPITAPSGEQQKVLLQKIYSSYGISPSTIQYIETHGTGTPIGDPTETNALADFFSTEQRNNKIPIGSVKTNIGHLESSAGTAGLIKVLLMMKHKTIVPSLHYSEENGNKGIDFNKIPLFVSTKLNEWHPHVDGTRLSCVNCFGFGGTNSHAIIKQIKSSESKAEINNLPDLIVAISATTPEALKNTCHHFLKKLKTDTYDIEDLSYTSILKRDHYRYRVAFAAKSTHDLEQQLSSKIGNLEGELRVSMKQANLIFLFCGVGTVWTGMCRHLLQSSKVFKDTVIEIDKEIHKYTKLSMRETLEKPPSDFVTDSFIGPIAIFTCQVGLFRMWKDLGVLPDVIIGQSVGEVAASYAAGCLSLSAAVKVTYFRTYLSSKSVGGRMLVVRHIDIGKLKEVCDSYGDILNIAVYSSNEACVVSGDKISVAELQETLSSNPEFQSVLLTELDVKCAYHSSHMTEPSKRLEQELYDLDGKVPSMRIISTVTGKNILGTEMGSAKYWSDNLRNPVLLKDGVYSAIDIEKKNIFLEIGPKPILRAHLKNITDAEAETIPSCNSPDDYNTFMKSVAALHKHGVEVNFQKLVPKNRNLTDIPRYKFYRSGTLLASDTVRATLQNNSPGGEKHPFVSQKPLSEQFKVSLSIETTPYIYEHILDHQHIAPGALHAEIGLSVSKSTSCIPLSDISVSLHFVKPIFLGKKQRIELDVYLSKETNSFHIKRKQETVCKGKYFKSKSQDLVQVSISTLKQMCPIHVSQQLFYDTLRGLGFEYGPSLTVIGDSWRSDTDFISELTVPNEIVNGMHFVHLHPCILDGALQTTSISWISVITQHKNFEMDVSRPIPIKLGALTVKKVPREKMYVYGKLLESSIKHAFLNILLLSENGEVIATIENYEVKNVAPGMSFSPLSDMSYITKWLPVKIDKDIGTLLSETDITLCICLSETAYTLSRNYFGNKSCIKMLLDIPFGSDIDSCKCVQIIFETMKSKDISFSEIQEIIYFPGYQQYTENLDTEEVYHCIKTSCLVLLKLLQKFMEETIDIPIFVLTKQTQPHITDIKHKYNLAGSELWGMCRCLVRERTYTNVRLVDFTEDKDLELLPIIIVKVKEDEFWICAPEFKVSDNQIYVNQVLRYNNDSFGFRMNSYNKKQSLELKSASHNNLQDLFFVPKSPLEITEANHLSLKVETAYMNTIFSPLTTTIAVDDPDPWKATRADGHQIIVTEVCGRIEGNKNKCSKENTLQCLKSSMVSPTGSQADISYVTCFPSGVSNTMSVPSRCLIPKKAFHEYRPGMMHEYIWYFALLDELKIGGPLGIIYEKRLPFDLNLLKNVLRSSKRKVTFVYDTNEFRDKYNMNGKYQLLLLVQGVSALMRCASKINLAASRIVTFSQLVNKPQERLLRKQWPNLEICIINNDDMLSEQKLSKLVKVLTIWLSKNHRLQNSQLGTHHHSNGTTIDFRDDSESTTNINCEDCPVKTDKKNIFNKSAGYMIIGGLTGLGWETVELIAKMGGGCVVILARRQPTGQILAEMKEMSEKYNCHIISMRADVSDFESVKAAFDNYHSKYHDYPLKGIFHGAVVLDDAIIVNMTEEKFENVLKPKIKGTLNLHILSKDMKLDYFILHSSITSVFGNMGQVNYGAGNSFMDTFAYYRRSKGLSGQTINWGALHLGLLTASEQVERHLNSQGYHSINPDEIMECLLHTLSNDFTQIVYGIFKWDTIVRQSPDMVRIGTKLQHLLLELNLMNIFTAKQGTKIIVDLEELQKLPKNKLYVKINEILILIAADLFALEVSMIQTTTQFTKLGIDSMTGMALINTIYEHLSCKIPVIAVLNEDANIESISSFILHQMSVSSDVTVMIPVDKMMLFKSKVKDIGIRLNGIEQSIYTFESIPNTFSFLRVDMKILHSAINEERIRNAFQEFMSLFPELTSVYLEVDGIPFRFVETSHFKEGLENVGDTFFDYRMYVPDEEDSTSFRDTCIRKVGDCDLQEDFHTQKTLIFEGRVVKIVCLKGRETLEVNLYLDRLLFDKTSTEQLVVNFVSILDGSHVKNRHNFKNIEQELNRAIREHKEGGERFWFSRVSMTIPPVLFGESQFADKTNETDVEITTVTLTEEVSADLKQLIDKRQMTNLEFFIGIYQLFLHLVSENDVISVASFVDMRQFLERSEINGSMENLVPYITTFHKDQSYIQFLLENAENIRETNKHGIIPFNDIQNMFTNTLSGVNAFMHGIFIDHCCSGDFVGMSQNVSLTAMRSFDSRFHTSLHISENELTHQTVLSLHYKPRFVQEITALQILNGLLKILDTTLSEKDVTMQQIREQFNSTQKETSTKRPNNQARQSFPNGDMDGEKLILNENLEDEIKFEGVFLKETTYGWDHKATVLVTENANHQQVLQWTTGKKTTQIDIKSIVNTKYTSLNGMNVVTFETESRQYTFKTTVQEELETLVKLIEQQKDKSV